MNHPRQIDRHVWISIFYLCWVLLSPTVWGQRQNDFIFAPSLSIKKNFSPRVAIELYQQYQLDENVTELGSFYYDFGIAYQLHRWWELGLAYRHINTRSIENYYETRHRYYAEIAFQPSFGKLNISLRERTQWQQNGQALADESISASFVNRFKAGLEYNLNWYWSVSLSGEVNSVKRNGQFQIARLTPALGTSCRLTNKHKIDLTYKVQKNMGRRNNRTDFMVVSTYIYTL